MNNLEEKIDNIRMDTCLFCKYAKDMKNQDLICKNEKAPKYNQNIRLDREPCPYWRYIG